MAAWKSALMSFFIFLLNCLNSQGQQTITAESGQMVILPCRAPNNNHPVIVVEWSRADLGDEYVFLYRDERSDPGNQHPSFKNRVYLQDRQMNDGDVSLIMKDVTTADTGIYKCRVFMRGSNYRNTDLISTISLSVVPPGQQTITAESGQMVTLPCRAPNNNHPVIVVEWSRADLGDEYVFLYRDERSDPGNQHSSFKNRVYLQDRQMNDGDVSLIMKDVTTADTGIYKCRVFMRGSNHRNTDLISTISLSVVPPGPPGGQSEGDGNEDVGMKHGSVGVIAAVLFAVVIGGGGVAFVSYKKMKSH